MRKWKLWLLLGSSSFLVFFLLLVATAAGSFADDVTAVFRWPSGVRIGEPHPHQSHLCGCG